MKAALLFAFLILLIGCEPGSNKPDPFDKQLVVVTRNAPTSYLFDKDGQEAGFEYELAKSFGKYLGKKVKFVPKESTREVLDELEFNRAHLAAAGLTVTEDRKENLKFSPTYLAVEQQVICQPGMRVISTKDLQEKTIVVPETTSYTSALKSLDAEMGNLNWREAEDESTETLLAKVDKGEIDCTLADSHIFKTISSSLPDLRVNFSIGKTQFLAWPFAPRAEGLLEKAETWFETINESGQLQSLVEKYFGRHLEYDYYDIKVFRKRIDTVLPTYAEDLRAAAVANNIPPKLLMAIAYQESQWNPKARSRTGVRGFMMLTQQTAKEMGVKNRLNAKESIAAGAAYLRKLVDRLPVFIPPQDRIWMGLASYNVGYGHLQDARRLAIDETLNANLWSHIQRTLPLLTKPSYYKRTRYGYARGYEPVHYVRQIRQYLSVLQDVDLLATESPASGRAKPDLKK